MQESSMDVMIWQEKTYQVKSGEMEETIRFYVETKPNNKHYFVGDAMKQGGFMRNYSFKMKICNDFDELCECVKNILVASQEEKISIRIISNPISMERYKTNRHEYTGMIYYTSPNYMVVNRELSQEQQIRLEDYILSNLMN